jgi:predicted nucleic acid-binding Zn finger protein
MVVNMHTTGDIIKQMQSAHYDNSRYAAKIAKYFKGTNITNTCSKIFNWIKDNVEYRIEPAHLQTTKSIQRLVADGYGDCKHYSGLFAAILSQLNIRHHYRFVSYTSSKIPTHVYVVAYAENGKQIICDAVLPNFNTEKQFTNKIDKNMLMHLSGIGEIDQIGKKGKGKAIFKKVVQAPKKAAVKVAKAIKKIPAGAKKIGIAPARAAFLTLVALNVRGFANKLQKNDQNKLKSKWNNLGGDFGKLQQAIKNGAAKKPFLSGVDEDSIGSVVGTALATSVPVIMALKEFIKENPQFVEKAKQAFAKQTGQQVEQTPFASEPDAGIAPAQPSESTDGMASGNMKYILLAGGAAALFLLTKKK